MDEIELKNKIVDFTWCKTCIHYEKDDTEKPCDDCLENPSNEYSRRPKHFKGKESE